MNQTTTGDETPLNTGTRPESDTDHIDQAPRVDAIQPSSFDTTTISHTPIQNDSPERTESAISSTATEPESPVPHEQINADNTPSKRGLLSFISGIVIAGVTVGMQFLPFLSNTSSSAVICIVYGCIALAAIAALILFSIPSFKKNPYPNLFGLIGLILQIIIINEAVSALILFIGASSSSGTN